MGKVLIQMAADADAEHIAQPPAMAAAFEWPAPPAKAEAKAGPEGEGDEQEEGEAAGPVEVASPAEPPARPVFFCRCAPRTLLALHSGPVGAALSCTHPCSTGP